MALSKDIGDQLLGNGKAMDIEQVANRPSAFVASAPVPSAVGSAYQSEIPDSATNMHLDSLTVNFSATAPATYGSGSGQPLGHRPLSLPIGHPSGLTPDTGSSLGLMATQAQYKASMQYPPEEFGARPNGNVAENLNDGPSRSNEILDAAEVISSNTQSIGFDFDSNKAGDGYGANCGLENTRNAGVGQDVLFHNTEEEASSDDTIENEKNSLLDPEAEQFRDTTKVTASRSQQIGVCDDLETPNGGNVVVANSDGGIEDISRITNNENSNAKDNGDSADKSDSDSLFGSDAETNYGSDDNIDDNGLEVDIWKLDAFDVKVIEPHMSLMSLPSTINGRQLDFIASTGHTIESDIFTILDLDVEPTLAGIDLSQLQCSPEVLRQRNILRQLCRRSNIDLDSWLSPGLGSCVLSNSTSSIETSKSTTNIDLGWRNNRSRLNMGPNKNLHNTMYTKQLEQAVSLSRY